MHKHEVLSTVKITIALIDSYIALERDVGLIELLSAVRRCLNEVKECLNEDLEPP